MTLARLHREAMQDLISLIVSGEMEPESWLPRETDIAAKYSVSRGVAREVIRGLEERGLVKVFHGRGAQITPSSHWDMFDVDVLGAQLSGEGRRQILRDFLECRQLVEIEASGLAAERTGAAAGEALEAALDELRKSAERSSSPSAERRFHQADIAFHRAIIDATGNSALAGLIERIHAALLEARYPTARPQYRLERAIPEHERIAAAIIAGDATAAREAMRAHLSTVKEYLDAEFASAEGLETASAPVIN
ncbi:MAG: FadR family transcriptional regulator [Actinobacteria bacterium]|nr:FadR family transcriptional regulator [Actinomycetota bacterium]